MQDVTSCPRCTADYKAAHNPSSSISAAQSQAAEAEANSISRELDEFIRKHNENIESHTS